MSILLKGFDMPKTCLNGGCPIGGEYCKLWSEAGGGSYGRHRDCPLVELPDHKVDYELTEEQVKEYCRKRGLILISYELFGEMTARWSEAKMDEVEDGIN